MLAAVLPNLAWWFGSSEPIALFLHRITPARHTVDFGKTIPAIYQNEPGIVAQALAKLAAPVSPVPARHGNDSRPGSKRR